MWIPFVSCSFFAGYNLLWGGLKGTSTGEPLRYLGSKFWCWECLNYAYFEKSKLRFPNFEATQTPNRTVFFFWEPPKPLVLGPPNFEARPNEHVFVWLYPFKLASKENKQTQSILRRCSGSQNKPFGMDAEHCGWTNSGRTTKWIGGWNCCCWQQGFVIPGFLNGGA